VVTTVECDKNTNLVFYMENIGLRICYKLWRKGLVIGIIILFFRTNIIPSTGIIEKERKKEDGNMITIFIYDNIYY